MVSDAQIKERVQDKRSDCVSCSDQDEDCAYVRDKVVCWLYDPQRGMCPFLRAAAIRGFSG
jgi:hypothetical protein